MQGFFEHQDRARRNTRLLVALMALGVLGMGAAIYGLLLVFALLGGSALEDMGRLVRPDALLGTVAVTALVVGAASSLRTLSLRKGGSSVAEMLGGRLVSGAPRDALEKRLVNVVEEMAIASGVPVPQVFVLDGEAGINAFAAGFTFDDAAIGVTRGSLEALTREELQGVIAHEFSHILHGDMRLNIRLIGVVYGIVCISLFGRFLMESGSRSSFGSRRGRNDGRAALAAVGLGVFLVGLIGELFGKLIKAAVSRQREFLADASAVQFTRNPGGIAGALKKIGGLGSRVRSARAEEASHLFFGDIHRRFFSFSPLATHPPLSERIRRLDASFEGSVAAELPAAVAAPAEAQALVSQLGTSSAQSLAAGRRILEGLPGPLSAAADSPYAACAIVYALLLADDPGVHAAQRQHILALSGAALDTETTRLGPLVHALAQAQRLPLVELLAPALRELTRDQRAAFSRTVQALVEADRRISLFEYVLSDCVTRWLAADPASHAGARVHYRSLRAVRGELELLLSLIAHAGGAGAERAFTAGAAQLAPLGVSLLPASPHLLSGLSPALAALGALAPLLREQVVSACAQIVLADGRASSDEITLLGAVCIALGCPHPTLPA
jgi:Zn-dependent protease with chaperone function/uncharacterized tellurite resistance protein B-like protein